MDTVFFETESIRLSMRSPETGRYLKSNVYTLEGVTNEDGSLREMSIGQLMMAICLTRATKLESDIVDKMEEMAQTTETLEYYSTIETDLANFQSAYPTAALTVFSFYPDELPDSDTTKAAKTAAAPAVQKAYPELTKLFAKDANGNRTNLATFLSKIGMTDTAATTWSVDGVDEIMKKVEEQMDSLNTVSQNDLIDIQSMTAKRDDTYSLISNALKSLYTVLSGNVNNL